MITDQYFDLMGNVRLKIVGADEKDLAMVRKQLGIKSTASSGKGDDITIRFVDQLTPDKMNYLGIDQFGFTHEEFYLLNPISGKAEVQIPLDLIGEKCEIVCQRGITEISLLTEILKITYLQKNILSLHASAVEYELDGVVITGWVRGGKTSALLAYIQQGAKFVADDWVLYDPEKDKVFGFPGKLSVSDDHLCQMPKFRSRVEFSKRVYLACVKLLVSLVKLTMTAFQSKVLRKIALKLENKLRVDLLPSEIFAPEAILEHVLPKKFLLMTSHRQDKFEVKKITQDEMVEIFIHSSDHDLMQLHETYLAYCFAFPDRKNLHLENRGKIERPLLKKALACKETFVIYHPYPLPFSAFMKVVKENL